MKVTWMPQASAQLDEIFDYIAYDSVQAADRMVDRIETAVVNLSNFPQMGRAAGAKRSRELVIPGTPYVVPYRIKGDSIEILAVFHGNQSSSGR